VGLLVGVGSPYVVALWVVACGVALWWLVSQGRKGALVTAPTYVVFFWFILPILLQYPFTFSPLNILATGGQAYDLYLKTLDRAFLVSLVGMGAFAAGFAATPKSERPASVVTFVARGLSAWSHGLLLWASGVGVAVLFVVLGGAGLIGLEGARSLAMTVPVLRPIYNIIQSVLPVLVALVLLMAAERRRTNLWVLAGVLLALAVLTGARVVVFGGLASFAFVALGYRSIRQELDGKRAVMLVPAALVVLLLVFYLGDVRAGQYDPLVTTASFGAQFFYGSNFSDLRDFAWILAFWDGQWLAGRTELAGVLGFIPAFLSPFRTEWGWGRVSIEMVGIGFRDTPDAHPGLRPGAFGEPYLNFGIPGVIIGGFLLGYVCVRLHAAAQHAVAAYPPFYAKLALLAVFTSVAALFQFYNTAGFFTVYVGIAVLVFLRACKAIIRASVTAPARTGAVLPAS
jgi:oligosaccharide repeat unit polymerase